MVRRVAGPWSDRDFLRDEVAEFEAKLWRANRGRRVIHDPTLDFAGTYQVDQATRVIRTPDGYIARISMPDLPIGLSLESDLFRQVLAIGHTRLPWGFVVPMLPPVIAYRAGSLLSGQRRPVISFEFRIGRDGQVNGLEVLRLSNKNPSRSDQAVPDERDPIRPMVDAGIELSTLLQKARHNEMRQRFGSDAEPFLISAGLLPRPGAELDRSVHGMVRQLSMLVNSSLPKIYPELNFVYRTTDVEEAMAEFAQSGGAKYSPGKLVFSDKPGIHLVHGATVASVSAPGRLVDNLYNLAVVAQRVFGGASAGNEEIRNAVIARCNEMQSERKADRSSRPGAKPRGESRTASRVVRRLEELSELEVDDVKARLTEIASVPLLVALIEGYRSTDDSVSRETIEGVFEFIAEHPIVGRAVGQALGAKVDSDTQLREVTAERAAEFEIVVSGPEADSTVTVRAPIRDLALSRAHFRSLAAYVGLPELAELLPVPEPETWESNVEPLRLKLQAAGLPAPEYDVKPIEVGMLIGHNVTISFSPDGSRMRKFHIRYGESVLARHELATLVLEKIEAGEIVLGNERLAQIGSNTSKEAWNYFEQGDGRNLGSVTYEFVEAKFPVAREERFCRAKLVTPSGDSVYALGHSRSPAKAENAAAHALKELTDRGLDAVIEEQRESPPDFADWEIRNVTRGGSRQRGEGPSALVIAEHSREVRAFVPSAAEKVVEQRAGSQHLQEL